MKIKLMSDKELSDAIKWMSEVEKNDPHFSNFNFDSVEYVSKFCELLSEFLKRNDDDYRLEFTLFIPNENNI